MASAESVILTNMCLVSSGDMVLVQRRNDPGWPGLVFPGGHVEADESFTEAVIREVREETGLTIAHPRLCGLKQFWTRNDHLRYIVFLYRTDSFTGQLRSSAEGEVFWLHREALTKESLAPGFADMLPLFYGNGMEELFYGENGLLVLR